MSNDRIYLSRAEVSQILGLSQRSVDYLLSSGRLRSAKLGRRRVVHREALLNFAGSDICCKLAQSTTSPPQRCIRTCHYRQSGCPMDLYSLCNKTFTSPLTPRRHDEITSNDKGFLHLLGFIPRK